MQQRNQRHDIKAPGDSIPEDSKGSRANGSHFVGLEEAGIDEGEFLEQIQEGDLLGQCAILEALENVAA